MQVSISKAHQMTGVARSTIYKDIKDGKLSVTLGARGKQEIMVAELQRVYGDVHVEPLPRAGMKQNEVGVSDRTKTVVPEYSDQIAVLQERLQSQQKDIENIRMLLEKEQEERRREREQLQEDKDSLRDSLKLAQEGQNRLTLQLENKQGHDNAGGEWEKSIKAMEARIANQEKADKERREREEKILRQNKALRNALKQEKEKSFFKKIFG